MLSFKQGIVILAFVVVAIQALPMPNADASNSNENSSEEKVVKSSVPEIATSADESSAEISKDEAKKVSIDINLRQKRVAIETDEYEEIENPAMLQQDVDDTMESEQIILQEERSKRSLEDSLEAKVDADNEISSEELDDMMDSFLTSPREKRNTKVSSESHSNENSSEEVKAGANHNAAAPAVGGSAPSIATITETNTVTNELNKNVAAGETSVTADEPAAVAATTPELTQEQPAAETAA